MPNQRDVYLAPFPYSDEETEKQRPVLIFSNSVFNSAGADVLVMAMTSNLSASMPGIDVTTADVELGQLPVPSRILPHKVYSVAQARLGKFYCRVNRHTFAKAVGMLQNIME